MEWTVNEADRVLEAAKKMANSYWRSPHSPRGCADGVSECLIRAGLMDPRDRKVLTYAEGSTPNLWAMTNPIIGKTIPAGAIVFFNFTYDAVPPYLGTPTAEDTFTHVAINIGDIPATVEDISNYYFYHEGSSSGWSRLNYGTAFNLGWGAPMSNFRIIKPYTFGTSSATPVSESQFQADFEYCRKHNLTNLPVDTDLTKPATLGQVFAYLHRMHSDILLK